MGVYIFHSLYVEMHYPKLRWSLSPSQPGSNIYASNGTSSLNSELLCPDEAH